jgi:endonuclease/exonuclease/phosphatase (EEP) superfamily protein YafD
VNLRGFFIQRAPLCIYAVLALFLISYTAKGEVEVSWECSGIFAKLFNYRMIDPAEALVTFGTAEHETLPNSGMRLMLWNAHKHTNPNWRGDFLGMRNRADIYLIQEAALKKEGGPAMEMAGKEWNMSQSYSTKNQSTGVATGSNRRALKSTAVRSPVYEPFLRTPKSTLISEFAIQGRHEKLMVLNIHAINFTTLSKFKAQLDHLLPYIDKHEGPLVVAGDMNTWNPWRAKYLKTMLEKHGLEEALPQNDTRMLALDRVFVRGMKMNTGEVVDNVRSSDHKPLLFEFKFD